MNYLKLEKALDRAFRNKEKAEPGSVEKAMATSFYSGMQSAMHKLGVWTDENAGKHTVTDVLFVKIYKNEDGSCECEKCELSAKCEVRDDPLRLANPSNPKSTGLCPKLIGGDWYE
ncbi:hypothetical protein LK494_03020 [Anaerovorax odorimutans]|nr:hypothetical protein [Anaerovorax odorimutans]